MKIINKIKIFQYEKIYDKQNEKKKPTYLRNIINTYN